MMLLHDSQVRNPTDKGSSGWAVVALWESPESHPCCASLVEWNKRQIWAKEIIIQVL